MNADLDVTTFFNVEQDKKNFRKGELYFSSLEEKLFSVIHSLLNLNDKTRKDSFFRHALALVLFSTNNFQLLSMILEYPEAGETTKQQFGIFRFLSDPIQDSVGNSFAIIFTGLFILKSLCLILVWFVGRNRAADHSGHKNAIRVIRFLVSLIYASFYPSIVELSLMPFNCGRLQAVFDKDFVCSGVQHWAFRIIAAVDAPVTILFSLLIAKLFIEFDPVNKRPSGKAHGRVEYHFTLMATLAAALMTLIDKNAWVLIFVCTYALFCLFQQALRAPHFDKTQNYMRGGLLMTTTLMCCLGACEIWDALSDYNTAALSLTLFPFLFVVGGRFATFRYNEIVETWQSLVSKPLAVGDAIDWDMNCSEAKEEKTLTRLVKQTQTHCLKRGVWSGVFRNSYFSTDVELHARLLLVSRFSKNSQMYRKSVFLTRLQFAQEASKNSDSSMIFVMYAMFLWFYTKDIGSCMELLRSAMGREPTLDAKFLVYCLITEFETYKQNFANGNGEGRDIITMLELRKLSEEVQKKHEASLKRLRNVWRALASKRQRLDGKLITRRIDKAVDMIRSTEKLYSTLLRRFPNAEEACNNYARFKKHVMHDSAGAKELLSRSKTLDGTVEEGNDKSSSFSSSHLNKGYKNKILVRETKSYGVLRISSIFSFLFVGVLCLGMAYVINVQNSRIENAVDSLHISFLLVMSSIASTRSFLMMDFYGTNLWRIYEQLQNFNPDTSKESYEDLLAEYSENLDSYEYFESTIDSDLSTFESSFIDLYSFAEENSFTAVLGAFTDNTILVDVERDDGTKAYYEYVNFYTLCKLYTESARALMKLSEEEDYLENDDYYILSQIALHQMIDNCERLSDLQQEEVEGIIDDAEYIILGAGIAMVCVGCFLSIDFTVALFRSFGLFTNRIPACARLASSIDMVLARKMFTEAQFHVTALLSTNEQQMSVQDSIVPFAKEEDYGYQNEGQDESDHQQRTNNTQQVMGVPVFGHGKRDSEFSIAEDLPTVALNTQQSDNELPTKRLFNPNQYIEEAKNGGVLSEDSVNELTCLSNTTTDADSDRNTSFNAGRSVSMNLKDRVQLVIQKEVKPMIAKDKSTKKKMFEVVVKRSNSVFCRLTDTLVSAFTRRILVLIFLGITAMAIGMTWFAFFWFEAYRSGSVAMTLAVDVRYHIRELALHGAALVFQGGSFESRETALEMGAVVGDHLVDQYRKLIYDDSISSARTDEIIALLYDDNQCLMSDAMLEEYQVADCADETLFFRREVFTHGLAYGFSGFKRSFDELLYSMGENENYLREESTTAKNMVELILGADTYDLQGGFFALITQFETDMRSKKTDVEDNLWILCIYGLVFTAFDLILTFIFVLWKLKGNIERTRFFIQLLPSVVIENTPFIFDSCIHDDIDEDVNIATI
eukprot:TRINITY_DN8315_c0_g1_i1.p1 TRINITY_DN8315_c0_g1~~TRINITY_DN8315_c0_g1_i1.p1  ORF type:complete len:1403 (-),score=302.19 TRINITY_DN8315_c0_g1_i1:256-4464(-)